MRVAEERLRERGRRGELYKKSHNYTRNHEYYTRKNIAHSHTHTHTPTPTPTPTHTHTHTHTHTNTKPTLPHPNELLPTLSCERGGE